MSRKKRIEQKLINVLKPNYLEVRDDSKNHSGHSQIEEGQKETHFYIKIYSSIKAY